MIKNGLEVCSDCNDYPCNRFDSEKAGVDSFVTHKKVFTNLDEINRKGLKPFIENQRVRIEILTDLLANFDDGRSKGFYCLSCSLLPLGTLREVREFAFGLSEEIDTKEKSKRIKYSLTQVADSMNIILKLNKQKTKL
ncbi:MAG: hypothetical protein COY19_09665 [Candidatus Marinimicrobia bacterium CG_4_10_14_0_2_um_filter_48_9]|nr:MAG: hypothetical protein COY19_09665 [Candidatus Marinimicrobia bacterium CG_4_10_14_0_2_um_filter_48_9]